MRIGLLLPRSTDYPAMGYDMLDGLKYNLQKLNYGDVQFFTENIGFGEDATLNYNRAEKLLLQDEAEVIIAYSSPQNAEALYPLAETFQKTLLILDAGMQLPASPPSGFAYHISLQGVHACRLAGYMAGAGNRKVLMATSFYDGGYRGPFGYDRGLAEAGGSVCGNYVSGYKVASFSIDPYIVLLQQSGAHSVAACFSSYLAGLFFQALHRQSNEAVPVPFYCSPFMAEEQLLSTCNFPGGEFFAVVPWASSLQNSPQEIFTSTLLAAKKKKANIFHLLGWEAALAVIQAHRYGAGTLKGFSYESPRGQVTIHPATHHTYAPLYTAKIEGDADGKCSLTVSDTILINDAGHAQIMEDRPTNIVSNWKNNYLCI